MVIKLYSEGLDSLCSKEHLRLLNAIDALRSQGIRDYVSLPQIIVCGDQSSGKSSVLEAISGVTFPVKSNLCTRFPTELILRKAEPTSVKVSIVPHRSRSDVDKISLSRFAETLDSFQNLPNLIENAKAAMGIMTRGKAFSKDLLRIEINGPDRPHLTIVDLPGLIHSENRQQSASDIDLITDVVKGYMKEPRSIILAVVSAKNDYANQVVLKLAREADEKGTRTLGIVTKPDTLTAGSYSEKIYMSLASNKEVELLGWHVLRNKDTDNEVWTLGERDAMESDFFSNSSWSCLHPSQLGIKTLRSRLSKLLLHQIASELPSLEEEIVAKLALCKEQLEKLGRRRSDLDEQRIYLVQISQTFQAMIQAAVDGSYEDPFFGDLESEVGYQKRFRAVVQNLNIKFASELYQRGRKYRIMSAAETKRASPEQGIPVTREEYMKSVVEIIHQTRGRELPGMVSPLIVSGLFKTESTPWKEIVNHHVNEVWESAKVFLNLLILHVADDTTARSLWQMVISPALDSILKTLQDKVLGFLDSDQRLHAITYSDDLIDHVKKIRLEGRETEVKNALKDVFGDRSSETGRVSVYVDFAELSRRLVKPPNKNESFAPASDALDYLDAYYKVALKRFIDYISVEVIEKGLVTALGQIASPLKVSLMSKEDVSNIAGETDESRAAREEVQGKLVLLQNGAAICKEFSGYRTIDMTRPDHTSKNVKPMHSSTRGTDDFVREETTHDHNVPDRTVSRSSVDSTIDLDDHVTPEEVVNESKEDYFEEKPKEVEDDWGVAMSGMGKKSKRKAKKGIDCADPVPAESMW